MLLYAFYYKCFSIGRYLQMINTNRAKKKGSLQGCQMVFFKTKKPNLGKFWRALKWKMLEIFNLRPFGNYYDHLVYFMAIW
jgi:hypothetical protein